MSKGLHYEDVLISKDELCGKYSSIIHKEGKNYARICYYGDEIYAPHTYCDKYLKENKLGKYGPGGAYYEAEEEAGKSSNKHNDSPTSSNSGGGKEVNPVSGNKKLVALAGLFAVAAACSPSKDASGTSSSGKKVLPKPKVAVSRPGSSTTSSTGKKSLISTSRLSGITSKRPTATSTRASIFSSIKSSSKSGGVLGGLKKSTSLGGSKVGKKSSILGGTTRKSSVGGSVTSKKSSSMFGTSSKSSTSSTKSSGLFGGTSKKSTSSTKSGGLFGGSSKKSGGLGLGKKRR